MESIIKWIGFSLAAGLVLLFLWKRKTDKKDPLYFDVNGKPAKLPTYLAHLYVIKDNHISLSSPPAKQSSKKKDDDWLFDLLLLGFLWNFFSSSSSPSSSTGDSSYEKTTIVLIIVKRRIHGNLVGTMMDTVTLFE